MSKRKESRIDKATERSAGQYLFNVDGMNAKTGEDLDFRTRINTGEVMEALIYYGILGYELKSEAALKIKNLIERLLVSHKGLGRTEAVEVLKQHLPKIREVEVGHEEP